MSESIIFNEINDTGIIILNRPKALNALNLEMFTSLKKTLEKWEKNTEIKKVLLKTNGNFFCAGGDVKSVCLSYNNTGFVRDFFKTEYELNYKVKTFSKPLLTIWNGPVMGGGIGISLYGQHRIGTKNTKLAMPETAIGFFPDVGTSYILSRMNNSLGLYLGLSGHILNYYESYKLGFANHYIEEKNIREVENEFIDSGKIKYDLGASLSNYQSELINNQEIINYHFSSYNINTIMNSLNSDNSIFIKNIYNHLMSRCPTSLALTCKIFKKAKLLSFKDCLQMDFHLSQIMVNHKDFINGVTELLINKNKIVKWDPVSFNLLNNNVEKIIDNISTKTPQLDIEKYE